MLDCFVNKRDPIGNLIENVKFENCCFLSLNSQRVLEKLNIPEIAVNFAKRLKSCSF